MIFFAEELRAWGEFGNAIFLENGRNFDGFFGSNSARKTGITGIPSRLFRIKAHSYLLICQCVIVRACTKLKLTSSIIVISNN